MKYIGSIKWQALKGMLKLTNGTDDFRLNLNHVHVRVTAGQEYWTATDGKLAGFYKPGSPKLSHALKEDFAVLLPPPRWSIFRLKADQLLNVNIEEDKDGTLTTYSANDVSQLIRYKVKAENWPKTNQIIPTAHASVMQRGFVTVNQFLLTRIREAANMVLGIKSQEAVTLAPSSMTCGVISVFVHSPQFYALVMPMRSEDSGQDPEPEIPTWPIVPEPPKPAEPTNPPTA